MRRRAITRVGVRIAAGGAGLLAALSTLGGSPAGATAAQLPRLGGFSVRPAQFDATDPATRAYFKLVLRPGGTFRGSVLVGNSSGRPARLRVYATDGLTGVTSGAVYSGGSARLRGAGRWLTPAAPMLAVGPHRSRLVGLRVRVPADASPGVYLGGVAVQGVDPTTTGDRGFAIREVFRVVVGVEIRVPGPAWRAMSLTGASLYSLPGTDVAAVRIGLANRGRLLCKPRLAVALTRLAAQSSGEVEPGLTPVPAGGRAATETETRELDTILPGDWIPYPMPWPTVLPPARYRIAVHGTGCGPAVTIIRTARLGGALAGTSSPTRRRSAAQLQSPPSSSWWLLIVVISAVIAIVIALIANRNRNPRRTAVQRTP